MWLRGYRRIIWEENEEEDYLQFHMYTVYLVDNKFSNKLWFIILNINRWDTSPLHINLVINFS